jgi:3-methyl-2-oxobutanoate hydroxymethyltransferase
MTIKYKKVSVNTINKLKEVGEKITALTAYDYSTAKYMDEAGIHIILVGDSLAMVALGYESTHSVGMDEMLIFTKAVAKGAKKSMVIGDMPFMSYHADVTEAVKNAGEFIKAGARAIKIEGENNHILKVVSRCTESGIPVLAHLGFTPQFENTIGGHNIQGKTMDKTLQMLESAKRLEKAGAFALVLELVPEESAKFITENINIPTLSIGAGRYCSGQILVSDDVFGKFSDFKPKFARKYGQMQELIKDSVNNYIEDVQRGAFPNEDEIFHLSADELEQLEDYKRG